MNRAVVPEDCYLSPLVLSTKLLQELDRIPLVEVAVLLADVCEPARLQGDASHDCNFLVSTSTFSNFDWLVWKRPSFVLLVLCLEQSLVHFPHLVPLGQDFVKVSPQVLGHVLEVLVTVLEVTLD